MKDRYVSRIPEAVPEDRWLVHNHVVPQHRSDDGETATVWIGTPGAELGWGGFRAWLADPDPEKLEVCGCGWAPWLERHYRVIRAWRAIEEAQR